MNEQKLSAGRRRRFWLDLLVNRYQPKPRRSKIPTVKSPKELTALLAQNNPPPKIKIILNGKKFIIEITKRGDLWEEHFLGHA